ncbi:MAG TPA: GH32 C-terminal domain-containing protein, partial [Catalimonadaceae bacterium]|nr:GH32 C-terminal domain-containing protein [Catalimonadaceae bacterium]
DRTKSGKVDFDPKFSRVTYAPRISKEQTVKMHLFFDAASMELFADDGSIQLTDIFFPTQEFNQIKLFSDGKANLKKGTVYKLKPMSTHTAKF